MGRLVLSTTMTVDGVIDGFEWYVAEGEHEAAGQQLLAEAAAVLLGRKTYEGLAEYWPEQEGRWADLINVKPKLVASRTLSEPLEWNARLLEGELDEASRRLKGDLDGDIVVFGCGELARNLLVEGVVDELRFWVHPIVEGEGARPFEGERVPVRLIESKTFDSGVTLLRYEPLGTG